MGGSPAPRLSGTLVKLFGENKAFTATMEVEVLGADKSPAVTIPGQLSFLDGRTRLQMDLTQMKGSDVPAEAAGQLKAMGMAEMTMVSRPDRKVTYLIYPALQSYAESPLPEEEAGPTDKKYRLETKELGKETMNGQACVKNQVVLTDDKGKKQEATVWNAPGLRNFPVRIDTTEGGTAARVHLKNVKFDKPEERLFEPPAGTTKYDSVQALMTGAMMKKFGGGAGAPPK